MYPQQYATKATFHIRSGFCYHSQNRPSFAEAIVSTKFTSYATLFGMTLFLLCLSFRGEMARLRILKSRDFPQDLLLLWAGSGNDPSRILKVDKGDASL